MTITDEFTNLIDEPAVRAEYEPFTVIVDGMTMAEAERFAADQAAGKTEYTPTRQHASFPAIEMDGLTIAEWLTKVGEAGVPATARMSIDQTWDLASTDIIIFEWEA